MLLLNVRSRGLPNLNDPAAAATSRQPPLPETHLPRCPRHPPGKSKQFPRVSVLVSNKTIRNNTNLKSIDLQQSPIKDVKQYLLKQGLIKVGTSTPNNVLRQMYESAKLLPGEVKNYNPENLLYNYFNTEDEL